jgi:hypothetical protein
MPRVAYENWKPGVEALRTIQRADSICREYAADGYDLTLRQLYYQFVARGLIPNNMRSYKNLGNVLNKARLAGLLDWSYIVDRTRNLAGNTRWDSPDHIIGAAAASYGRDLWADQAVRVELWVEKEALAGIVERVASEADVDYFSCRGYVSQSELWGAAQRHMGYIENGQRVVVLHLGDHDPSGIDMSRDIRERLELFMDRDYLNAHRDEIVESSDGRVRIADIREAMIRGRGLSGEPLEVRRIALNFDQPPNPAKLTDSRARGYIADHGYESWELDALDPAVLAALMREHITGLRDDELYDAAYDRQEAEREQLQTVSDSWEQVVATFC